MATETKCGQRITARCSTGMRVLRSVPPRNAARRVAQWHVVLPAYRQVQNLHKDGGQRHVVPVQWRKAAQRCGGHPDATPEPARGGTAGPANVSPPDPITVIIQQPSRQPNPGTPCSTSWMPCDPQQPPHSIATNLPCTTGPTPPGHHGPRYAEDQTFAALGDVDELNSALGVVVAFCDYDHLRVQSQVRRGRGAGDSPQACSAGCLHVGERSSRRSAVPTGRSGKPQPPPAPCPRRFADHRAAIAAVGRRLGGRDAARGFVGSQAGARSVRPRGDGAAGGVRACGRGHVGAASRTGPHSSSRGCGPLDDPRAFCPATGFAQGIRFGIPQDATPTPPP
jgi:hypothetical protein